MTNLCYLILIFKILNFKSINEIFGFNAGDALLCEAYLSIEQTTKPLVLARLTGDLFACLYLQKEFKLEQLSTNSIKTWSYTGKNVPIHFLHGIYFIEDKNMSVSSMIDRARMASKHIVDAYVKPYAIFDDDMRTEYIDQAQILFDYEHGIEHQEVEVYYQPIINAVTQEVASAEALVRWNHPERGYIRPDLLVSVLEKNGHITKLDRYMLERVAAKLSERAQQKKAIVPVAVNLSWMDLYDENMRNTILDKINHSSVPKGYLRFEATETAFNTMEELCKDYITQIRNSNAKIALDDFGSGYSSFSMIQSIKFDILKIDMEFVKKIEVSPDARNIICAILAMCHEMNIAVVAEGVETKAEYEFLRLHGCDYIQGYYFAKPMPEEAFYKYLEDGNKALEANETYLHSFVNEEEKEKELINSNEQELLSTVLDRTGYFIQVCDPDTMEMIYANQATRMISGKPDESYIGQKCYKYMLNLDEACAHCPMRLMRDENQRQLEVDDGNYVFSLTAQYFNWNGKRYFMEMGCDVSEQKKADRKYDSQILAILKSIPEQQGMFHINVTQDECISSSGNAKNARDLQNIQSVDTLIGQISLFVPDEEGQRKLFETFCRDALLKAHEAGEREISLDTKSYYDDKSIRWSRITAYLLENPKTNDLEAVLHGTDISKEKEEEYRTQISDQKLQEVMEKYHQADQERRVDFLTGLNNRKDLFDYLQKCLSENKIHPTAMFMIDVDNFKVYNDTYGHVAGDECLKKVAFALKEYGKAHDICFFRYGGEEILGILEAPKELAYEMAQGILYTIRNLNIERNDGHGDIVTVSVGYTTDNSRYEKMIDKADQAMYLAKSNGKNQVVCFESDITKS